MEELVEQLASEMARPSRSNEKNVQTIVNRSRNPGVESGLPSVGRVVLIGGTAASWESVNGVWIN